jgi:cold shock CspA family protein
MATSTREHGVIRTVFDRGGYGFVTPDASPMSKGVFFHATDVLSGPFDELTPGLGVTFTVVMENGRPRAVQVVEDGKQPVPAEERRRRREERSDHNGNRGQAERGHRNDRPRYHGGGMGHLDGKGHKGLGRFRGDKRR